MILDDAAASDAGPILAGLHRLCVEQKGAHRRYYLTDAELEQIADVLRALGYVDSYGAAGEWYGSLKACLIG